MVVAIFYSLKIYKSDAEMNSAWGVLLNCNLFAYESNL